MKAQLVYLEATKHAPAVWAVDVSSVQYSTFRRTHYSTLEAALVAIDELTTTPKEA